MKAKQGGDRPVVSGLSAVGFIGGDAEYRLKGEVLLREPYSSSGGPGDVCGGRCWCCHRSPTEGR